MTRHISRDQTIAGISCLEVRRVLRRVGFRAITKRAIQTYLPDLSRAEVNRLWKALHEGGYIAMGRLEDEPEWANRLMMTDKGWDLVRATGALPITRKTADRLLATTLDRADMRRAERMRFAYTPDRMYVYGSYITEKERLGDLNIAVEWEPRYADRDDQFQFRQQFAQEAAHAGRQFSNYVEYLYWGFTHAELFLRNRARGLSLSTVEFPEQREHLIYRVPHRIVYEHGVRIPLPATDPQATR